MKVAEYYKNLGVNGVLDFAYSGGFIFKDGSILDIGEGEDHRIIDVKEWNENGIITYRIINCIYNGLEIFLRINNVELFNWSQLEAIKDIFEIYSFNSIVTDLYNDKDVLVESKEFNFNFEALEFLYKLL